MKLFMLRISLLLITLSSFAQRQTENIILITTDGLRWQEVFGGADSTLLFDPTFTSDTTKLKKQFWASTAKERRQKLLPFFWDTVAKQGQLYGNRDKGSKMNVSNAYWFSYPGYNEILSGFADERINSTDKIDNPNTTVLEFINRQPKYQGKVASYATWDVVPHIINEKRTGIPVNAGHEAVASPNPREQLLNEIQDKLPSPWGETRQDFITYYMAKEYIQKNKPKVFFLSFDETDDYAHAGKYDQYLLTANLVDKFIADLWNYLQSQPEYKGKTTILLTTDHGRGHNPKARWKDHGTKTPDSYQIWMGAMGPDTPAKGEVKHTQVLFQNQIAQTVASALGLNFTCEHSVAEAILTVFK
jgi:hypothetical protein